MNDNPTVGRRKSPAQKAIDLTLDWSRPGATVSPTLYGLFVEDINFGIDGGLNANLVPNWSFEGTYLSRANGYSLMTAVMFRREAVPMSDPLRHWQVGGGTLSAEAETQNGQIHRFARLRGDGAMTLKNEGYLGNGASMGARANVPLAFKARFRTAAFTGEVSVELIDARNVVVATEMLSFSGTEWQVAESTLTPSVTGQFALRLVARGHGVLDVDDVRLYPSDHWGAGDRRWSQGVMRRDLVSALKALRPSFLRFPGGCIVEGVGSGSQYDWRYSVGPLERRVSQFNLWAESRENGDYAQSNQIGFYEYFLLCEDLGMEPIPVVWAGLSCQYRSSDVVSHESHDFAGVVQSAVDMIDWATGDPDKSAWARLRAEAGHPEPFKLNYVGIGNENHGHEYLTHFDVIKNAMEKARPGMTYILSTGAFPRGKPWQDSFDHARGKRDVIVDEHCYAKPKWYYSNVTRYDNRPRTGDRIMMGEYAAHPAYSLPAMFGKDRPNTWESAVAEAAFLTGVERNADLVAMTCYAPLFANYRAKQWRHNLIEFSSLAVQPSVNYEVQRLFGEAVGVQVIPIKMGPTNELYVSATGGNGKAYVKLVNAGSREQLIKLTFGGKGSAELTTLVAAPKDRAAVQDETETMSPIRREQRRLGTDLDEIAVTLPPFSVSRIDLQLDQQSHFGM